MLPTETPGTILLGEDEPDVRQYLATALKCRGFSVKTASDGEEVLSYLDASRASVGAVLLDITMPRKDGIETLREIRRSDLHLPVIMVSGASSPATVVEALRFGATDFVGKPVSPETLTLVLRSALDSRVPSPYRKNRAGEKKGVFLGESAAIRELQSMIPKVGWSDAPVLIQGETGVGKEVLARLLHSHSARSDKPLLKLNCAALPSELIESELFGYEKGAFTGAFQKKLGMFEIANGGTIFLDEIGDMEYKLQAKLLQVLQDGEFLRLGGRETVRVDVRILAATHNDVEMAVRNRTFREDLFYRLNVIGLRVPPLRERPDDVLPLAEVLLQRHAAPGVPIPAITPVLERALILHTWPGNVRELENTMRRLLVLGSPEAIARELSARASQSALRDSTHMLQNSSTDNSGTRDPILEQVMKAKDQVETKAILAALSSTQWNRKEAAALLRIDYKALLYKMKKLSIDEKLAVYAGPASSPA